MTEHKLERRSRMLADAMKHRVSALKESVTPEGDAPPFTERLSRGRALEWWTLHRYDAYGEALIKRMQPQQVMDLDVALSQQGGANGR